MSTENDHRIDNRRMRVLAFALTFGLAVIVARLVQFQILEQRILDEQVTNQRIYEESLPPERGAIFDINGNVLAMNTVQWDIAVSPALVTEDADKRRELVDQLATLLNQPTEVVSATIMSDELWARLATHVDYETGEAILDLEAAGIECEPRLYRFYPEGELVAHAVGIVNETSDGFYGVEGYFNHMLKGTDGTRYVERNPLGDELPLPPLSETPPTDGRDLRLTLDRNIQYIAEQELQRALEEFGAESGTVVIMNPKSGAILAAISYPTYDPNRFADADPELLDDPTVSKMWEPGSIFKIITWAAGLDSGTISPGTTFHDEGAVEVGGRVIRNWNLQGNGLVTMRDGLVKSLNTVAAFVSTSMGKDRFYTYLRRFGFGTLTDVDLDSEGPGMMKLPGDSDWFPSELGTNSFGQGIAVTPMQMIVAVSAVANGGMLMRPHILDQYTAQEVEGEGTRTIQIEPMVVRKAVSQQTAETLTNMLVEVIEEGATNAQVPGYRIAGKTGTAQIPTAYGYHPTDTIASFVGFAPADDPQFIVLIKLDRPTTSPWGSQTAAPTFRAIAERLFVYLQIPPDEIRLARR
jgi:cell division protein FtsI/penicillin-binding protein 2